MVREAELTKRVLELQDMELRLRDRAKQNADQANDAGRPLSELYKELKRAVFVIYAKGTDGIAQGSGFLLNSDGVAVSNYHVLEGADTAIAVLDDSVGFMISQILEYSKEKDYVVFRLAGPAHSFPHLAIAKELPAIGDECFAITNPKQMRQTLSAGLISGYRAADPTVPATDTVFIQTTAPIGHGSSGGPLFNRAGEVIGVTTWTLGEANLNFAISIKTIPLGHYLRTDDEGGIPSSPPLATEADIRARISRYYAALFSRDYATVATFYAPHLTRYFSRFDLTRDEAVRSNENYWTAAHIMTANNSINWRTLSVAPAAGNGYLVSYNMDYVITREARQKPTTFNLDIFVEFTSDLRIRAIYENILTRR